VSDVFTKRKRSEVMSRIRGRGNKDTELALAKLLRAHGIGGWRRHLQVRIAERGTRNRTSSKPGVQRTARPTFTVRPDFVFKEVRIALFVDGCFWHGCPKHATRPKNNAAFWRKKLTANVARDRRVNRALRAAGWRVLRIWEHELKRGTRILRRGSSVAEAMEDGGYGGQGAERGIRRAGQGNLQPSTCNVQLPPVVVRRVQRALIQGGSGSNRGIHGIRGSQMLVGQVKPAGGLDRFRVVRVFRG
jgi:DNA mismatch endonuclease (patch repair protein)